MSNARVQAPPRSCIEDVQLGRIGSQTNCATRLELLAFAKQHREHLAIVLAGVAVVGLHQAILAHIPPDEMASLEPSLAPESPA